MPPCSVRNSKLQNFSFFPKQKILFFRVTTKISIFVYAYLSILLFLGNKAHRYFTQNVNKPDVLTQEFKVGKTK